MYVGTVAGGGAVVVLVVYSGREEMFYTTSLMDQTCCPTYQWLRHVRLRM